MTLTEMIEHCEEVAEEYEQKLKDNPNAICYTSEFFECAECAKEHRQLVEWLRELEAYREADKEMRSLTQAWEEGAGINRCIETIDKYIDKVVTIKDLEWRD